MVSFLWSMVVGGGGWTVGKSCVTWLVIGDETYAWIAAVFSQSLGGEGFFQRKAAIYDDLNMIILMMWNSWPSTLAIASWPPISWPLFEEGCWKGLLLIFFGWGWVNWVLVESNPECEKCMWDLQNCRKIVISNMHVVTLSSLRAGKINILLVAKMSPGRKKCMSDAETHRKIEHYACKRCWTLITKVKLELFTSPSNLAQKVIVLRLEIFTSPGNP